MRSILLIALTFLTVSVSAQDKLNYTNKYVNDFAGILTTQEEKSLQKKMSDFEDKTSIEFTVVTVKSLEDRDVESFTNDLFNKWGVGNAERNDGLMLLIAPNERKWRVEVGYGLEKWLTDGYTKVEAQHVLPDHFKQKDYFGGIDPLVTTFIKRVGTQSWAERDQEAKEDAIAAEIQAEKDAAQSARNFEIFMDVLSVLGILLVIGFIIGYSIIKRRKLKWEADQLAEKILRTQQTSQLKIDTYRDKFDRVKLLDPDGDYSDFEKVLKSMECVNVWGNHALWNPTLSDVTDAETELNELSYAHLAMMDQIIKDYKDLSVYKDFVDSNAFGSAESQINRRVEKFVERNNASEYTVPFSSGVITDQLMVAKTHNSTMKKYMDIVNIGNLGTTHRMCTEAIDKANSTVATYEATLDAYVSAKQNIQTKFPKIASYVAEMNASLKDSDVKSSTKSRAAEAASAIQKYSPRYDMSSVKNSSIDLNRLLGEVESVRQRARQDVSSAEEERRRIAREKRRREEEEEDRLRRAAYAASSYSSSSSSSSSSDFGSSDFGSGSSGGGGSSGDW